MRLDGLFFAPDFRGDFRVDPRQPGPGRSAGDERLDQLPRRQFLPIGRQHVGMGDQVVGMIRTNRQCRHGA